MTPASDRISQAKTTEAAGGGRAGSVVLLATLLADVANKREELRLSRSVAWCGATAFGVAAGSMWAWDASQSHWIGPAWIAGSCGILGLLCDGAAAMIDRLRWRLEQRIV